MMLNFARVTILLVMCSALSAYAQVSPPRIGFGLTSTLTTDSANPVGLGLHVRGSLPVNPDLSFAAGAGFTGFVLSGRDDAEYYVAPQVLAIVTLDSLNPRSPYVLFGVGGYVPIFAGEDTDARDGPTLNAGMGWAVSLQETSVYVEVMPSLVIDRESSYVILPLYVGVVL